MLFRSVTPHAAALALQYEPEAALAGGITGAIALLLLTALLMVWIGRREGVRLLEPVVRPVGLEAPAPLHI